MGFPLLCFFSFSFYSAIHDAASRISVTMVRDAAKAPSADSVEPVNEKQVASPASSTDDVEFTSGINEKALLRRLDLKLLPAVTLLYLLSFLDRSNGTWSTGMHDRVLTGT